MLIFRSQKPYYLGSIKTYTYRPHGVNANCAEKKQRKRLFSFILYSYSIQFITLPMERNKNHLIITYKDRLLFMSRFRGKIKSIPVHVSIILFCMCVGCTYSIQPSLLEEIIRKMVAFTYGSPFSQLNHTVVQQSLFFPDKLGSES
ncbi:unnamed protein product [Thelazia callipaeda]|uniref:Transposase n=1 Tax=Thelazia callipaeda TaxID=103827 RepID=A0A0N5D800_THECL|nr:unnamed protein product [Thelazia callipaeda]